MGEFADLKYGTSLPAVRRSPTRGVGTRCRVGYGGLAGPSATATKMTTEIVWV